MCYFCIALPYWIYSPNNYCYEAAYSICAVKVGGADLALKPFVQGSVHSSFYRIPSLRDAALFWKAAR